VGPALAIVIDVIEDAPQLATQHFYQSFRSVRAVEIAEVRDIRCDLLERPRDGFGEDEIVQATGEGHPGKH
jgi:hypothetical protein